MTIAKEVNVKLDRAMEMLNTHPRMKASVRNDLSLLLKSIKNDVLAIEQSGSATPVVPSLEAKIKELTALVELQASYIHNNIKPVPVKATTISFLSKEQPDKLFGVYSVSPEWIKSRFGTNTYNHAALEAAVRVEAQLLGQKQIGHNHFSIRVIVNENMTQVRFSIATQPVNSITSIIPQHGVMYNPLGGHARCDQVNNFNIAQWLEAANRLKEGPYLG